MPSSFSSFLLLLLMAGAVSCSSPDPYQLETMFMDCLYQGYQAEGTNLKEELNKLEKQIIADGLLKDASGESYAALLKQLGAPDAHTIPISDEAHEAMGLIKPLGLGMGCPEATEAIIDAKEEGRASKLLELSETFDQIAKSPNISIPTIIEDVLIILEPKDFEHPLYRAGVLMFLVTKVGEPDYGLVRRLPPPPDFNAIEEPVKERNVMVVLINTNDLIFVEGELIEFDQLRETTKEFIANPLRREDFPEFKQVEVPLMGMMPVSQQVISLQSDNGASFMLHRKVQGELAAAYNELREELAQSHFGMSYQEMSENKADYKAQLKAIRAVYPKRISEAESIDIE